MTFVSILPVLLLGLSTNAAAAQFCGDGVTSASCSWTTSWSTSCSTSWSTMTTTTSTTSTSTSTTSVSVVSLAASATACANSDQYQADDYCGCTYKTICAVHPSYPDDTILLGYYGLDTITDNHVDFCADKCDNDNICVSAMVDIEQQRCLLYNELPTGVTDNDNYNVIERVNNGPGSCVNDSNGICLANIP